MSKSKPLPGGLGGERKPEGKESEGPRLIQQQPLGGVFAARPSLATPGHTFIVQPQAQNPAVSISNKKLSLSETLLCICPKVF